MPKISIVLTSYNHEKYIRAAIDSVLNQTFTDYELIIWDDASSDKSWQIIQQHTDSRIKSFRNDKTRRGIYGINKAISEIATGDYIAIHHSDDVWEPEKLKKQVEFLDSHLEVGAVFTQVQPIDEDGEAFTQKDHFYYKVFDQPNRSRHEWLRYFFLQGNALCHPSVLIRKHCYEKCGLYRFGLAQLGDFDMWIRLCLKYEIHVMPENLLKFRVRLGEANTSGDRPECRKRGKFEYYEILTDYIKVTNFHELQRIFPEATKYFRQEQSNIQFALAMVFLELKPYPWVEFFGLDLLYKLIQTPGTAVQLKDYYQFDYLTLIRLTGEYDAFGLEKIDSLNLSVAHLNKSVAERDEQVVRLNKEVHDLDEQIQQMLNSKSWRLTEWCRSLARVTRQILRAPMLFPYYFYNLIKKYFAKLSNRIVSRKAKISINNLAKWRSSALDDLLVRRGRVFEKYPEIDVSIVTFNSERWLENFMDSLIKQNYPLQKINLLCTDNGSTDNTRNLLTEIRDRYGDRFNHVDIKYSQNLGFGRGHDNSIRRSNADYILVTNVDLEFETDAISNVVAQAQADDPEVVSWEMRQQPFEHPKYYDPVTLDTSWSSHACVLMRRKAYFDVGGYEKRIFMYGEDVELSYRFRRAGYRLKYVPSAVVFHYTYEHEHQVKPLQFYGSTLANAYIRLRYGDFMDIAAIVVLYTGLLLRGGGFKDSRRGVLRNIFILIANTSYFLASRKKAPFDVCFSFRFWDYEIIRDGAFYQQPKISFTSKPIVSIITRTYKGRESWLREVIANVLQQTYPNIEMIVVEDGGDSHKSMVDSAQRLFEGGKKLRYSAQPKHGRSYAGNIGLEMAKGDYIVFLDDDDLLFSDHLEVLTTELMANDKLSAAYALAWEVLTSNYTDSHSHYYEEVHFTPSVFYQEFDRDLIKKHNYLPIQSVLFKRELFNLYGGFDIELDQLEDWDLWVRYSLKHEFKYIPKTTSLFRTPFNTKERARRHKQLHNSYEHVIKKQKEYLRSI